MVDGARAGLWAEVDDKFVVGVRGDPRLSQRSAIAFVATARIGWRKRVFKVVDQRDTAVSEADEVTDRGGCRGDVVDGHARQAWIGAVDQDGRAPGLSESAEHLGRRSE